jgi:hypothetical protein
LGHNLLDLNINASEIFKESTPPRLIKDVVKEIEEYSEKELYDIIVNSWTKEMTSYQKNIQTFVFKGTLCS